MSVTYALVPFRGDQLLTINDRGVIRVAVKPICEALGIDWPSQFKRLNRDPVLSEGVVMMTIPSERGAQETVTLPLDFVHGWLFTLDASRVRESAREAVISYQRECYKALADYWQQGTAINSRLAQREAADRALAYRELPKLLRELEAQTNPAARRLIHGMVVELCQERGYEAPALDEIGRSEPGDREVALDFFERLTRVEDGGTKIDHSSDPAFLALRLNECEGYIRQADPDYAVTWRVRQALRSSKDPEFLTTKTVRSNLTEGTVYCWVFRRLMPWDELR